jgi:hypothetical protein
MSTPETDPTLAHLLNLPPLLHPLSPELSALHLARVRLLLSIPSPHPSLIWCDKCGGLRERATKKRKRVFVCTLCGLKCGVVKPHKATQETFPNARKTRRLAKAEAVTVLAPVEPIAGSSKTIIKDMPPTLLSTPTLKHVPTSHPSTPTYPIPPPKVHAAPAAPGKKKKKSGLAKLLAENKARKEESLGAGNWGLG